MGKKTFYLFFVLFLLMGFGCGNENQTYKTIVLTPSIDSTSPTGVYIPKNLEEGFIELKKMLPPLWLIISNNAAFDILMICPTSYWTRFGDT